MTKVEITVKANADLDDCLAGAAAEYISERPDLEGYDLSPRWADEHDRELIVLSVPAWAVEVERMSMSDAREWARECEAGDYLIEYEDDGLDEMRDPGSRCGFGDDELDEIERILRDRDLSLQADDCGLVAVER